MKERVVIIGAGAAGMMAAIAAARKGSEVHILEKNEKAGKKLYITGKGRCNVTNDCDVDTLLKHVVSNPRFLYSAFYGFTSQDMMELLSDAGLTLKTERGGRVFPGTDKASDVTAALLRHMHQLDVHLHLNCVVKEIRTCTEADCTKVTDQGSRDPVTEGAPDQSSEQGTNQTTRQTTGTAAGAASYPTEKQGTNQTTRQTIMQGVKEPVRRKVCAVIYEQNGIRTTLTSGRVIVATGGRTYPSTGSTGDGYMFAKQLGHTVTKLMPSLVPLQVQETWCKQLMGLSLKNVKARFVCGKKVLYEEIGEMLFTHFGVSGPLVLSGSAYAAALLSEGKSIKLVIDLKPGLKEAQLDSRVLRDFSEQKNRHFCNSLSALLPAKLIPVMVSLSGIDPHRQVNEISRQERLNFVKLMKNLTLTITGTMDYNEAVITHGGVSVREVNSSTMESKLVEGLYFAGEVLDLDALTGGFNLQIAWSTGWAAGTHAGQTESAV